MRLISYSWAFIKIWFMILANYLVGLTEEEYHIGKANVWAQMGWYRWAIWNYKKALKSSDDSVVRAALGWCYSELGMSEAALEHYRRAHRENKRADITIALAFAEYSTGHVTECRRLIEELRHSRAELNSAHTADLERLERIIARSEGGGIGQTEQRADT